MRSIKLQKENKTPDIVQSKTPFFQGDIVFQASTHITGRIIEITTGPEPKVFIQSGGSPPKEMSLSLAITALTKLPMEGLQAQVLINRNSLTTWEKDAPLKLVALALIDLNKAGKPAEIKREIDGNNLLSTKWENWWKRVQPALKQSPYFRLRFDGAYELLTSPDQVSGTSLPSVSKKKEASLSQSQLLELIKKLETGEDKFEDVQGVKTRHKIARELTKRSDKSPQIKGIIISSLQGSVVSARIMLDEYTKKADKQNILDALIALLDHIVNLLSSPLTQETKSTEHLNAKLKLFQEKLAVALSSLGNSLETSELLPINRKLLDLATGLVQAKADTWRKSSATILLSLGNIATTQPAILTITGRELATMQEKSDACVTVAKGIVEAIPNAERDSAMRRLIAGALVPPVDYPDRLIQNLLPRDKYLNWLAENIKDILQMADSNANMVINPILEKIGERIGIEELASYFQLIISVTLTHPRSGLTIPEITYAKISDWACNVSLRETNEYILDKEAMLSPVILAIKARMKREQNNWEKVKNSLQLEISNLQNKILDTNEEINRLQSVIEELKSSYHMPEKWTEYRAKKDILERLGMLHQEIFALKLKEHDDYKIGWILQQVETILKKNGISVFGNVNDIVVFNPSRHEFIRGAETSEKEVKVQYPGFLWKDPSGNSIVLVRARVARI